VDEGLRWNIVTLHNKKKIKNGDDKNKVNKQWIRRL
jgi:hypothetical protein